VAGALLGLACGSGGPTPPDPPAATPTPLPAPTPSPTPSPEPGIPPAGSGCGQPYPAEISRVRVVIHLKGRDYWTLDATPLVGPDALYCIDIGFTDLRPFCPVRPEGHPERDACESWAVGRATDTGRLGPTWSAGDAPCTGPDSGCENHPDNQYLLNIYRAGVYRACVHTGACGEVVADR